MCVFRITIHQGGKQHSIFNLLLIFSFHVSFFCHSNIIKNNSFVARVTCQHPIKTYLHVLDKHFDILSCYIVISILYVGNFDKRKIAKSTKHKTCKSKHATFVEKKYKVMKTRLNFWVPSCFSVIYNGNYLNNLSHTFKESLNN